MVLDWKKEKDGSVREDEIGAEMGLVDRSERVDGIAALKGLRGFKVESFFFIF